MDFLKIYLHNFVSKDHTFQYINLFWLILGLLRKEKSECPLFWKIDSKKIEVTAFSAQIQVNYSHLDT